MSLDYYRRESMKIITMFKDCLPGVEIGLDSPNICNSALLCFWKLEKASIDEAFYDFTRCVRDEIIKRYPQLTQVPPDAPNGIDSALPPPPPVSWDGLGTLVPITPRVSETEETSETDGQEDDAVTTWHDVALSIGAELMGKVREEVKVKLGYTTSAVCKCCLYDCEVLISDT